MIKVEKIVQQLWPEAFIESIWENVASMPEVERDKSTKLKGSKPVRACPSGHWPMARPRFFWMRDKVEVGSRMLIVKKKKYNDLKSTDDRLCPQQLLGKNHTVHATFHTFPTFVQSGPKKSLPLLPAGKKAMDGPGSPEENT